MATKRKRLNLSKGSFEQYAKEIRAYRKELEDKTAEFVLQLTKIGYDEIRATLSEYVYSGQTIGSLLLETSEEGGVVTFTISVTSEAILILEFGSGIKGRDAEQNPRASEFGMGPGTFSPGGHWDDPNGWYYQDGSKDTWQSKKNEDGSYNNDVKWKKSYGHVAAMPFHQADLKMKAEVKRLAKEIFGG